MDAPEVVLPELRHYSAIWRTVKLKGHCILVINPKFFKRFKAAISKEKLMDLAWNKTNAARLTYMETSDRTESYALVITLTPVAKDRRMRSWLKQIKHKQVTL